MDETIFSISPELVSVSGSLSQRQEGECHSVSPESRVIDSIDPFFVVQAPIREDIGSYWQSQDD